LFGRSSIPHDSFSGLRFSGVEQSITMPVFKRYVEVGRVVLINCGPENGKLATIVDIVDQNKCLVDGPFEVTGVNRQVISYTHIALTDLTVKVQRNARQKTLVKAWKEGDVMAKWEATSWAKKLSSKKKRASLSDFDRFKVMVAKKQKAAIIAKKMAELS
jgi:large subunit ribosomal protein L14e